MEFEKKKPKKAQIITTIDGEGSYVDLDSNPYEDVMKVSVPICVKCKHFNTEVWNCEAFPEGVPEIILTGRNSHSKPLPNQGNDIVFELIKKKK